MVRHKYPSCLPVTLLPALSFQMLPVFIMNSLVRSMVSMGVRSISARSDWPSGKSKPLRSNLQRPSGERCADPCAVGDAVLTAINSPGVDFHKSCSSDRQADVQTFKHTGKYRHIHTGNIQTYTQAYI